MQEIITGAANMQVRKENLDFAKIFLIVFFYESKSRVE